MRFISTKTHGILDYFWGILLILSPWLFNFANGGAAQIVPMVVGFMVLLMALVTNYELGAIKKVPMSTHLTMDIFAGVFLVISPWLFGFADVVYLPHLIFGIFAIGAGMFTKKVPTAFHVPIHGHS